MGIKYNDSTLATLYVFDSQVLNTFNRHEAEKVQATGEYTLKCEKQIELKSLYQILEEFGEGKQPDFLSVDVEGLDFEVLSNNQIDKIRPKVLCVETLTFTTDNTGKKLTHLIEFIEGMDYLLYADTHLNSIFVDKQIWEQR